MNQSFELLRVDGPNLYIYDRKLIESLNNLLTTPIIPESFHANNYKEINYKWLLSNIGDLSLIKLDSKRCSISLDLLREYLTENIKGKSTKSNGTTSKNPSIKKGDIERYSDPLDKIHRVNTWLKSHGIDKNFVEIERVSKKDIRYKLTIFVIHTPTKKRPIFLCDQKNVERVKKMVEDYEYIKKLSDMEEQNKELNKKIDALSLQIIELIINSDYRHFVKYSDIIWKTGLENFRTGTKTFSNTFPRLGLVGDDKELRKLVTVIVPFIISVCRLLIINPGREEKINKEIEDAISTYNIEQNLAEKIIAHVIEHKIM